MYDLDIHPSALQELKDSYLWYEERSKELGDKFLAEVQKCFNSITRMPELYAKKKGPYREVIVKIYPYTIVYEVIEKRKIVFVTRVFHTKRNPRTKYR